MKKEIMRKMRRREEDGESVGREKEWIQKKKGEGMTRRKMKEWKGESRKKRKNKERSEGREN